jgi:putative hydrolase of the HAD superfamily
MFNDIRVLCFDLDNTFWDVWPVIARAERAVHDWLLEHHPRIPQRWSIEEMRAARMELARAEPEIAHDVTALRVEALVRHARELGEPESVGARAFDVFHAARNNVTLYDDVRPALAALRRRFRLATLSNGNADMLRIGLAGEFELCLTARDVGAAKPDVRAFHAVLQALGAPAHQVAYVGDDPHADVAGARAAGLRSIWVDRGTQPWPEALRRADLEVRNLTELAATLAGPDPYGNGDR